ncbi:zinc finger, CCHC-type containing protein [Tanacetum coccineum]
MYHHAWKNKQEIRGFLKGFKATPPAVVADPPPTDRPTAAAAGKAVVAAVVTAAVWGDSGEEVRRRRGAGDTTGSHRKSTLEKFFGGGAGQWRLPEIGEEGERELGLCVFLFWMMILRSGLTHQQLCRTIVRLLDPKLKTLGERGIECIFVRYVEPSKAFGFYVIALNELDLNGTEDIGGLVDDPKTFDEAIKSQDEAFWKEAINEEIDSIMGNNTWVLADLPLGCKWIFKGKLKVEGIIEKFKARLVIQGFRQNLIIHQMDVKTAFLNGKLEEEAYMNQPQGFIMPANENKVDLTKEFLSLRFSMKDMGEANVILGIRIKHKGNRIEISQSHYIEKVVSQLKYSRLIGCLMYDMTCTRPDIAFAMGKLRRYTSNHGTQHWQAIQRVFLLGGGAIFGLPRSKLASPADVSLDRYAVSSLMDMMYRLSELYLEISLIKL